MLLSLVKNEIKKTDIMSADREVSQDYLLYIQPIVVTYRRHGRNIRAIYPNLYRRRYSIDANSLYLCGLKVNPENRQKTTIFSAIHSNLTFLPQYDRLNSVDTKNREKWLNISLLPVIFTLALPTILEQLMATAVQYVDMAMVGSLGTAATAAVGATTTVNWLVGSTISAIGVGFIAFISQSLGAGKKEQAVKAASQSVLATLIVGAFFTILTVSLSGVVPAMMQVEKGIRPLASKYFFILYLPTLFRTATIIFGTVLRSAHDTKTPMLVGIAVNVTNVLLNFFLLYDTRYINIFGLKIKCPGAGLGVTGAAVASAAAFALGGILITIALFRHPVISPKGQSIKPDKTILSPVMKVAFPNMLQRFFTSFGYVVFASLINSLGAISTTAHTIANTVESAFYVPGYGMMTAAATLSGNAIGAKDARKLKETSRMIFVSEIVMMIVSGALLFVFAPTMVSLFSKDEKVIELGSIVLRMVSLSEPFYGVSIVTEGILQGAGETMKPFIFNTSTMWGIRIVGTFICIEFLGLGLVAAWACMIAHNLTLLLLYRIYYKYGSWNPLKKSS